MGEKKNPKVVFTAPFTLGVMKSSFPSGWIKSGLKVLRLVSLWAWMFRHCEAPGSLPLAETNILLAVSRLDGFSTFLFKTFSVRQTIEIRWDRKPNRKVSQVAIQVGVLTNIVARQACRMVKTHLLPSVSDCRLLRSSRYITFGASVFSCAVISSSRALREHRSCYCHSYSLTC